MSDTETVLGIEFKRIGRQLISDSYLIEDRLRPEDAGYICSVPRYKAAYKEDDSKVIFVGNGITKEQALHQLWTAMYEEAMALRRQSAAAAHRSVSIYKVLEEAGRVSAPLPEAIQAGFSAGLPDQGDPDGEIPLNLTIVTSDGVEVGGAVWVSWEAWWAVAEKAGWLADDDEGLHELIDCLEVETSAQARASLIHIQQLRAKLAEAKR